ncbi:hypothetical protein OG921_03910 [Aldersonia sp. NBC_00410]|uniref:hypothetical protein n=1 Tax=Aldersonia sp. NBC_00410 TaxID=2975954 RepID=UPI002258B0FF|nr:hypothetical protein [Aldersonia sp. NBC_00410]MCX5042333.1 hypothetical protein [Aldersonia sp. NBC_00410]
MTDSAPGSDGRARLTVCCDHGHEDRPLVWEFERIASELGSLEWVEFGRGREALLGADGGLYRFECDRCGLAVEGRADVVDPEFDRLASRGIRRIALDRLRAVVGA